MLSNVHVTQKYFSDRLVEVVCFLSIVLTLSTRDPFDANPPKDEHGAVVIDMKEADLGKFLPQDEKDCVQEFHSFGDVIPPKS